ncbi:MAG: histidine kinase [Runella slithyformis]|nr:MAG: histidine kinase [Runella slithyformis]TAF96266.1 MAG: histidine kinase [Runella sp.]TAG19791.1 MAG: histidine kinase [Cytophagales bacterium]TAG39414.1 MAG: histidine kinase [Cytophagia bacterium]TAF00520.1 MAG: histidine kinase [Runella slithyformis]
MTVFLFPFLVALFLIPFVQKFLQTAKRLPQWHQRLRFGRVAAFVLLGVEVVMKQNYISAPVFFGLLILAATPAYLLRKEVSGARLLLWMIIPFGLVFLIDNLAEYWTPQFYKKEDDFFDFLQTGAIIGLFITAIMARNQQKNLDKALQEERIKLQLEEEANRILEAKKLDLEHQVSARTAELVQQKEELQQALEHLKATQQQLIQSEKLASLGELTAGIAHEIQNPLNFVNNFSELSVELAKELKEERLKVKGERDEELENELIGDLIQNQEKINLHGKRASSIVKGMLEHSRASTGVKELTDINKLADEYLRLSYHGIRAKDNTFNADFKTDFDENLPQIAVIPQDMGRVLLNLVNNAFYAVSQRHIVETRHALSVSQRHIVVETRHALSLPPPLQYQPTVTISTQQFDNQIVIKVKDNGTGMTEDIKAKIFQPFFTNKPTGEGTGLGLSLAYDIVTKGHGGTLEVESVESQGTTFTIKLPI